MAEQGTQYGQQAKNYLIQEFMKDLSPEMAAAIAKLPTDKQFELLAQLNKIKQMNKAAGTGLEAIGGFADGMSNVLDTAGQGLNELRGIQEQMRMMPRGMFGGE